jgi:fluoride ion exporter CrcB/FEX
LRLQTKRTLIGGFSHISTYRNELLRGCGAKKTVQMIAQMLISAIKIKLGAVGERKI